MTPAPEIRDLLPHREPMLLVDRIESIDPGVALTAVRTVAADEPWCLGGGAYPAVLVIESWCQAASLLAAWQLRDAPGRADQVPLFGAISALSVHDSVRPGEVLTHRVRLERAVHDTWMLAGTTTAGSRPVLTVTRVTIALRDRATLPPAPVRAR
jgi:3-hydroxyacyl-[acyl-carrier-protein] dehydratase